MACKRGSNIQLLQTYLNTSLTGCIRHWIIRYKCFAVFPSVSVSAGDCLNLDEVWLSSHSLQNKSKKRHSFFVLVWSIVCSCGKVFSWKKNCSNDSLSSTCLAAGLGRPWFAKRVYGWHAWAQRVKIQCSMKRSNNFQMKCFVSCFKKTVHS